MANSLPKKRERVSLDDIYATKVEEVMEEQKVEVTTLSPALLIDENNLDGNFQLTQDAELNNFFAKKAVELHIVEGTSRVEKGKILQEVFDELSGKNQYDEGLYEKWLLEVNENKRTALRYRYRYQVYSMMETDAGRGLAAIIGTSMIDAIIRATPDEQKRIVEKMEEGIDKSELKNLLIPVKEETKQIENESYVIPFYKSVITFGRKIDKLEGTDVEEALKEVEEMERHIAEYKKKLMEK